MNNTNDLGASRRSADAQPLTRNFRRLGKDRVRFISPPRIDVMMTGAQYARQFKDGRIELTYTDGATESRLCDHDVENFPTFFAIVSFVQAGRNV